MVISRRDITHFLQYVVAGLVAFACEYGTFLGLYYGLKQPILLANTVAFLVGLSVSFTLARLWVFRHSTRTVGKQAGLYVLLALFNLIVTNVLIVVMKHYGLPPWIGKLVVMCLIVLWNFLILRNFIFAKKNEQPA